MPAGASNPDKNNDKSCSVGNPCQPSTGAKVQTEVIYSAPSANGLNLWLRYRSQTASSSNLRRGQDLGHGWLHRFNRNLTALDTVTGYLAQRDNGQALTFKPLDIAQVNYVSDADQSIKLVRLSSAGTTTGWRLIDDISGIELYRASGSPIGKEGILEEIWSPAGGVTRLTRGDGRGGKLISTMPDCAIPITGTAIAPKEKISCITDNFGRQLHFVYGQVGNLAGVIDPAGQIIKLEIDGPSSNIDSPTNNSFLTAVRYQDDTSRTYYYNEGLSFTSGNSRPYALTGIQDELGTRYSTFTYHPDGSAKETTHSNTIDRYQLSYVNDANGKHLSTDYTTPLGTTIRQEFEVVQGMDRVAQIIQPIGTGSSAATTNLRYDANGNVSSRDDFNAHRTCTVSDLGHNLETTRVEGLPNTQACTTVTPPNATLPANSRKISTEWHPDWRLAIKVAEPGKITTYVYNGQPDPLSGGAIANCAPSTALLPDGQPIAVLCRQVEQATTDTDGHLGFTAALQTGVPKREQKWTYNDFGQVLTHDGPRTDIADITTYAYYSDTTVDHTMGDLQSMANALGQVTHYTKYNPHGQLLESIDPNGVITAHTYDLRQRLLSTSVNGHTTSYTYDAAGQLLKVTAPDASWIGYEYDPAHRLVATKDNLGNRIDYTLDNAGNRTAEAVKDPGGVLRRQLSRSIDALGRYNKSSAGNKTYENP